MALILRSSKSVALTHSEMDGNFTNLNNRTTTVETNYIKTINSLTATSNALTITTTNITEGTNLYYTDARARAGVSVTDSGGDGSLSYNSSTGVVTYTGPSATEVRAHFSAGAGITVSSGAISIAADAIKDTMIDWGTGSTQVSTADIPENTNLYYTDARARAGVSVTDSGGDGSLSYNSSTGVVTYTGPSATEVRAHFTAGEGIDISAGAISGEDATAANKGIASFSSDHFDISSGAVTLKANGIDDTHIDWGTGTAQVSTADIPENTNLYYTNARADARITAASIADLSNVTMASLVNGYGLVYNSSSSQIELAELPGAAGGEANQGSNLGGFNEVFKGKSSVTLQFRTLTHDNNITITQSTNYLTIGLGTISSLVATTADINAGTVDAVIGGTTPAAGNFTTISASGVATAVTFEPTADTSASDNAAIGYTSAEGLILTGQGSTSDITFKNDADTTVFTIPTGTDDILFPDNAKAMWGASSDLVIYHDGSDSHIKDQGTGDLYISAGDDLVLRTKGGAETALIANDDGSVDIYYDNNVKFATTSTGVDVTGDLTATLTIQPAGDTAVGDNAAIGYTSAEGLILTGQGSTSDITLKNDADGTVFTVPTGTDDILFPDNAKAMWGASSDLQIYHSGSHSFIDDAGTGDLYIRNDNTTYFQNAAGSATKASFTKDGNVNLYYNGTSTAMTAGSAWIPGTADGSSLGNAATEWSDLYLADGGVIYFGADQEITLTHTHNTGLTMTHTATADNSPMVLRLKSEEDALVANEIIGSIEFAAGDSDGTDGATVAAGIHAIAEGTFSASANATKLAFTTGVSETAASSATAKMTLSSGGNLDIVGDAVAANFQPDGDTASGDTAAIGYTSAEGLILTGQGSTSDITLKNDDDTTVFTVPTGTDDILFPDNAKAMWGASSDLQIYHNGSHSYISDQGTGSLILLTNSFSVQNAAGDEQMATSAEDDAVTLYHDALPKLATSSAGVTVTGNVTATTFVGALTGNADTATKVTVTDSSANTNFPVTFHDESNALLDDTGALRYNPSSGTLLVTNLTVSGTTTTVDTVTMNAANAIIFEGATADSHETTLTITDPTADRTITLPNVTGTIALTSSDITGNAATATTATTLATGRNFSITGDVTASAISFNGSGNVVLSAGSVDATTVKLVATNTTDATHFPTFVDTATGSENVRTDTGYTYNPSSGTLTSTIFSGTATEARYADLAELYLPDSNYPIGTVVMIGGVNEITYCSINGIPAGVISDKPAYLMNSGLEDGLPVALVGRVKVRVVGKVQQGQLMRVDFNGVASAVADGASVGIAIEKSNDIGEKLIECLLKV